MTFVVYERALFVVVQLMDAKEGMISVCIKNIKQVIERIRWILFGFF